MPTKQLYIVLTRSQTVLSNLIHRITGDEYTHAALSLDKDLNYMFSFGRRYADNPFVGCFRRESLNEGVYARHNELPGIVFKISVTQSEYDRVSGMIGNFLLNNHCFGYSYLGLMNGLLGIKNNNPNRFLCSEFVYYVLHSCGICDFGMPGNLVRPQDLLKINGTIVYKGNMKQYTQCAPSDFSFCAIPFGRIVA